MWWIGFYDGIVALGGDGNDATITIFCNEDFIPSPERKSCKGVNTAYANAGAMVIVLCPFIFRELPGIILGDIREEDFFTGRKLDDVTTISGIIFHEFLHLVALTDISGRVPTGRGTSGDGAAVTSIVAVLIVGFIVYSQRCPLRVGIWY